MTKLHATSSLWMQAAAPPARPALRGDIEATVCVVGAGSTGLTTTYLLATAGLSVVVLEADRVAAGATGNTTAKVTSQHGLMYADLADRVAQDAAGLYAAAQQDALEWVAATVQRESLRCDFRRSPAYVYGESDADVEKLEREDAAAHEVGLPSSVVDGDIGLPWSVPGALKFENQAMFHARKYC